METSLRALNRFGLGARLGEARQLGDPREWLRGQLRPGAAALRASGLPNAEDVAGLFRALSPAQRDRSDPEALRLATRRLVALVDQERQAALEQRVRSETPFVERLVAFWSNHLCVSAQAKQTVAALAGLYEREAIRPHVLGRFEEMVRASARHPAMLLYLDNAQSFGPGSAGARWVERVRGRERGLNENYARELLELHTLGVDGGYDQQDVEALARVLTGWTVEGIGPLARPGAGIGFAFRPQLHEPGSKRVLGVEYREAGQAEGDRVIADLCSHPSTARFVASKLVRHFVADEPPGRAVAAIETVFRDTQGDLREVAATLIDLDEAWQPDHRKFRTPQDWLIAVARALRIESVPLRTIRVLQQLRHPLWAPAAPKGYDDTVNAWADPDGLMNRAELARTVADALPSAGIDPHRLLEVTESPSGGALSALLLDRSIPARERVALAIAGPDFQWR